MKKFLTITSIIILLLLVGIAALPFVFKDKIAIAAKDTINQIVNAKVEFEYVGVKPFKHFPNISISLNSLTVDGVDAFDGIRLAEMHSIDVSANIISLFNGDNIEIVGIELLEPKIHAMVLSNGLSNWDIIHVSVEENRGESQEAKAIDLNAFVITDAHIIYEDYEAKTYYELKNLNFAGKGHFDAEMASLNFKLKVDTLNGKMGEINYLKNAALSFNARVAKSSGSVYTLNDNILTLNDLKLNFEGSVELKDNESLIDLDFAAPSTDFKDVLSMVPAVYTNSFDKIATKGDFAINGNIVGEYSETSFPLFTIFLEVNDAWFKYEDLPKAVSEINFQAKIYNKSNHTESTAISVKDFTALLGEDIVQASLEAKDVASDPYLDFKLKTDIALDELKDLYPLDKEDSLSGELIVDLYFKGKMSDLEAERYNHINAGGAFQLRDILYSSNSFPKPIAISLMQVKLNPKNAILSSLSAKIGESDISMNGRIDNLMAYTLSNEILKGNFNISSNYLNDLDWTTTDEHQDNAQSKAVIIPDSLAITANLSANELLYDGLKFENVNANILIKDQILHFRHVSAKTLGGSATVKGKYNTQDPENPSFALTYDLKQLDIQESFNMLNTVKAIAPAAQFLTGRFSSQSSLDGFLDEGTNIDFNTLSGLGDARIPYATVNGFPLLQKIAEQTKLQQLDDLQLKDAWTIFEFKDGKVHVKPYQIQSGDIDMLIKGWNSFDQQVDYDVDVTVPSSKLGSANALVSSWIAKSPIPGVNGLPEKLTIGLKVTGDLTDPAVNVQKISSASGKSVQEEVKNEIENAIKEEVDEIKQEAEDKVEEIKTEAENKAQEEIDKAKAEAEQKAQEELDKAKDKLKGLFGR